jgi:hypothetical protein
MHSTALSVGSSFVSQDTSRWGCNTDSVLPIEVLQKASRRRKQTDVLAWCADVDAKGLERLREVHLEMLVGWKLKEQPERHSFRPYLGQIENDYRPDRGPSQGKATVDRGLSILKRTLLISDAVAIADPLTRYLYAEHTGFWTLVYRPTGSNGLHSLASRLYDLWPAISEGVVEIVQPEIGRLARKELIPVTDERKFLDDAQSAQQRVAHHYFYRHYDIEPEALMGRLLFASWSGAYDTFVDFPKEEYSLVSAAEVTRSALYNIGATSGLRAQSRGVAGPRLTLQKLTELSLPNLDAAGIEQILQIRQDGPTWMALRAGIEEAINKAEVSVSRGPKAFEGAVSFADEVAGEADRLTERLTTSLNPPSLLRRVGRATYRAGIALVAPVASIALGAGPAAWIGGGVGLGAAAIGVAVEEKKDRKARAIRSDLEVFRTLLSGDEKL